MLALVTCSAARAFDVDLALLTRELPDAEVVDWHDATVEWSKFDVVVIRSTWDYHTRRDEFLAWAKYVDRVTSLWNPISLIEWNTDKRYLRSLAEEGLRTVPSAFVEPGETPGVPAEFGEDLVVKPSIGAGSMGVQRGDAAAALAHIDRLHRRGLTAMVQPYMSDIDRDGETGLVYLCGAFSHAFRKSAILASPIEIEGGLMAVEESFSHVASDAERRLGDAVIATLPATAYARVDLVPSSAGPIVLELELTEPSLFLQHDAAAPARAAAAFRSLEP